MAKPKTRLTNQPAKPKRTRTPPDPSGDTERLTGKQRMFVAYYLGEAKQNATQAARMAGYAHPGQLGYRLIQKSSIRAAIDAKLDQVGLTADEILAALTDQATSSLDEAVKVDKAGNLTVDWRAAKAAGLFKVARKLKQGEYGWELELYDAQAALQIIARCRGMLKADAPHAKAPAGPHTIPMGDDRPTPDAAS